jgi:hypothetical protein
LAVPRSALAVSWATGSGGGNWIALSPTSADVGIGTSTGTDPAEKLTVAGGNILLDNNRWYRGKLTGGTSASVIGLDNSNNVSIYGGKVTIASDGTTSTGDVLINGRLGIGWVSPIRKLYVDGETTLNGRTNVTGGQLVPESGFLSLGHATFANTAEFNDLVYIQDLNVGGNLIVWGGKSFAHPHPTDETKRIVYVAAEAGEALTMARGLSRTENGRATVRLPDHFALVTSEAAPLTVQLTVEGAPALIYVVSKSREAIEVKMKDSDYSEFQDVTFDYFVQGVRDGFEDHIAIQDLEGSGNEARMSPKRARYLERVKHASQKMRKRSR